MILPMTVGYYFPVPRGPDLWDVTRGRAVSRSDVHLYGEET